MWPALTAAVLLMTPAPDPPAPPPSRVVFASVRTGVAQLYSMEPSGAGLAQLTFGAGNWGYPIPSPDGRFVAAFRGSKLWPPTDTGELVPAPRPELWLMRADGSGARLVSQYAEGLSWSPDSRRLVFVAGDVYTVAAAGGRPRLVSKVPYGVSPTLSPDGRSLAFVRKDLLGVSHVVVRRNGHDRTVARDLQGRLVWSPNGRWIAIRDSDTFAVVRASGGVVNVFSIAPGSCFVDCVAWSPNSRRLAVETGDGIELTTPSPASAGGTLLVKGFMQGLAWSPHGDEIAFATKTGIGVATPDGHTGPLVSFGPGELQWEIGWSPGVRALRYRTPEASPFVPVPGRELEARSRIWQLSADGDRAAYWMCPHSFGVWRPGAAPVVLGSGTDADCLAPWDPFDPADNVGDLVLAGDRLAYLTVTGHNDSNALLWVTTLERGDEGVTIASGSWTTSDWWLAQLGDLVGGGSTLVYGQRGQPPELYFRHHEEVWRVDGVTPVQVASRSDDLKPLAVDGGRIVGRDADGSLELLGLDGRVLETFDVPSLGAALAGDDLVVLVQGELRDYSVASGELLHAWPLPDVRSTGHCLAWCGPIQLTLDDAARGVVVYTLDGVIHLLRLRDGADVTVPGATAAEITDAGLFYAYPGEEPWPSRIRFIPFGELPL